MKNKNYDRKMFNHSTNNLLSPFHLFGTTINADSRYSKNRGVHCSHDTVSCERDTR